MDPARKLVERRESSLHSLFELSNELNVGLDPFAIAQLTLFNLMGHFGVQVAALWQISEGPESVPVLMRGFGIGGSAGQALGAVLVPRVAECASTQGAFRLAEWEIPEAARAVSLGLTLVSPVMVQERLLGVVGLGARIDSEPYGSLDLEYLVAAAGMVGVALENAHLYQLARESNRRLRETNQRLEEMERLRSEFLGNVNHELRTPLTVIRGNLDILETLVTEQPARERLEAASQHATKLEGLIQKVLDFSRLEDQGLTLQLEPHDLGDLLRDFTDEWRPGVTAELRELMLEVEPGLPPARCDRRRLIEMLEELVGNAVKFTAPGSHIRVRAFRRRDTEGDRLAIEVRDDGPGIPSDRLEALFEPFRQGDGSTTREAGGMGVGLALARRLAEAMDAQLAVTSEPGVGSSFAVSLKPA